MNSVVKISDDGLIREEYWFYLDRKVLFLDVYVVSKRKTKRHGFLMQKTYKRIDQRNSTMKFADVPLDDRIGLAAIKLFTPNFCFGEWPD